MALDPNKLLKMAEAKEPGTGWSFMGGKEQKWEEAAQLYVDAANAFRMSKQDAQAGQAFEKAAYIQTNNLKEPDDAANNLEQAFKVYSVAPDADAAERCANAAIAQYLRKGNFRRAATSKEKLADMLRGVRENKRALVAYDEAAGWYESDGATASSNKLYLLVAELAAEEGDYYKAIELFEKVAASAITKNLLKWSVKDYFFKSGICLLAVGDMVAINRALEKYRDMDPSFASTREHLLLVDLAEAVAAGDKEAFVQKLYDFDQVMRLDKWKTTILLKVKEAIEEQGEDFS